VWDVGKLSPAGDGISGIGNGAKSYARLRAFVEFAPAASGINVDNTNYTVGRCRLTLSNPR